MPFVKLVPRPGIFRDRSRYSTEGGWYDCDKVRFRNGVPESIGGWIARVAPEMWGRVSAIHAWSSVRGNNYLAYGTSEGLYVEAGDSPTDITPAEATKVGTMAITANNPYISYSWSLSQYPAETLPYGKRVAFSGATGGGNLTTDDVNGVFRLGVDSAGSTGIVVGFKDGTLLPSATYNSLDVTAHILLDPGLVYEVGQYGWGFPAWGGGVWGGSLPVNQEDALSIWSLDNYGEDLVACVRYGPICYWDGGSGTSGDRALFLEDLTRKTITLDTDPIATVVGSSEITITDNDNLSSTPGHGVGVGDKVTLSGATAVGSISAAVLNDTHTVTEVVSDTQFKVDTGVSAGSTATGGGSAVVVSYSAGVYYAPTSARQVLVSPEGNHLIAFGCNPIGSSTRDPMLVRWSDSGDVTTWKPTEQNLASGQRLSAGSRIVASLRARQEVLIWTDSSLVSMRYGGDFVFSFDEVSSNVSLVSPKAAIYGFGATYFMDRSNFYRYDGALDVVQCPVRDYVFSRLSRGQDNKVFVSMNSEFGEVTWYYPSSSGSGEVDSYVTYNVLDQTWAIGSMDRSAWRESSLTDYPVASRTRYVICDETPFAATSAVAALVVTVPSGHGFVVGDQVIFRLEELVQVGGFTSFWLAGAVHNVIAVADTSITVSAYGAATSSASGGPGGVVVQAATELFDHEYGYSANGAALSTYVESSDMDIDEGDHVWFLDGIVPDVEFMGTYTNGDGVTMKIVGKDYPGSGQKTLATKPATPVSGRLNIRGRARQIVLRIESAATTWGWRHGATRIDGRPDGRRR